MHDFFSTLWKWVLLLRIKSCRYEKEKKYVHRLKIMYLGALISMGSCSWAMSFKFKTVKSIYFIKIVLFKIFVFYDRKQVSHYCQPPAPQCHYMSLLLTPLPRLWLFTVDFCAIGAVLVGVVQSRSNLLSNLACVLIETYSIIMFV